MSNNLSSNPIVIDTLSSTTTVSLGPLKMFLMELYANGGAGYVKLDDSKGDTKAILSVPAATGGVDRQEWHFPVYVNDLFVNATATFPAGSYLLIYV